LRYRGPDHASFSEASFDRKFDTNRHSQYQPRDCCAHFHAHDDFQGIKADFGPNLTHAHQKLKSKEWLYTWLREPIRHSPRTKMPNLYLEPETVNGVNLDPAAVEACVDKYLATAYLDAAGLRVPPTIVCQDAETALAAFNQLGCDVVAKPLFGSEGRGMVRIADPEERQPGWIEDRHRRLTDQLRVEGHRSVEIVGVLGDLVQDLSESGHSVTVITTTPHYNRDPDAEARQPMRRFWGPSRASTSRSSPAIPD
jgi:hypothetical protein